jgi:hypothetical protein
VVKILICVHGQKKPPLLQKSNKREKLKVLFNVGIVDVTVE